MLARMRYELTQRVKVTEFKKRKIETVRRASGASPTIYDLRGQIVHGKCADKTMGTINRFISTRL